MQRLKVLGLAAVALVAISVVTSASASAAQLHFKATGGVYPVKIKAEGANEKFAVNKESEVTCKKGVFKGELTKAVSEGTEFTLSSVAYSECTAFGFVGATVKMNGCVYDLHVGEVLTGNSVDVVNCEAGKKIEITVAGTTCKLEIGAQAGLKELTYKNLATAPKTIEIKSKVTKIATTVAETGTGCPAGVKKGETVAAGEYTGTTSGGDEAKKEGVEIA